jgi:enoyl-CoA hydratase/carnithine racemase
LHCDLVYATPEARFQMPFVNLGLVPEAGSSLLAPQRFGRARASELLLLAEPFGADRALELGLLNAIVPRSELMAHAMSKAASLAAKPRAALLATRRLMRGDPEALKSQMAAEMRLQRRAQIARGARGVPGVSVRGAEITAAQRRSGLVSRRAELPQQRSRSSSFGCILAEVRSGVLCQTRDSKDENTTQYPPY